MEYFNNQAPVYIASNLSSKTKSEKWAGTELEQEEQRCARVGSARQEIWWNQPCSRAKDLFMCCRQHSHALSR